MATLLDEAPATVRSCSLPSLRDEVDCNVPTKLCLTVVVLGASGDLAKKKTFPALFTLHYRKFLPENLRIIGYARTDLTDGALRDKIKPYLKGTPEQVDAFLSVISYVPGTYDTPEGFQKLQDACDAREVEFDKAPVGRLYYLALPPSVYPQVTKGLRENCTKLPTTEGSWLRVIVEKPFGFDLASSEALADKLGSLFPEEQLYRIDHYLGKELMQNMLIMRFANTFLSPTWNRNYISNVQISFKEPFGTAGRGGYFDQFGIIRDVIQNHLMQVLALVAMEQPVSLNADDIRDEKVKVLRCIQPVKPEETVLGQYTAGNGEAGYLEDPTVPAGSKTPTFATCVLHVQNDRWAGVPFIMKAGKALNERKAEVRIQFKQPPSLLNNPVNLEGLKNELVFRVQPDEAIYLKLAVKKPGLAMDTVMSELDLSYKQRYSDAYIPDAYERLILDCIRGDQQHFVRRDELRAAWAIFTPLLHAIDRGELEPLQYQAGSRGPPASDEVIHNAGFVRNTGYVWRPPAQKL